MNPQPPIAGSIPVPRTLLQLLKRTDKGMKTINSILKERPEAANWWIEQEKKFPGQTGGKFRINRPEYIELLDISKKNDSKISQIEDDQMTCFCHD